MVILRFVPKLFLISFIFSYSQTDIKALWIVRDHMANPQFIDQVIEFAQNKHLNFRRTERSS